MESSSESSSRRFTFSMTDCVVVLSICFVGISLVTPRLQHAREDARLNDCKNQARSLTLAVLNHESATQRFPLAMFGGDSNTRSSKRAPAPFTANDGYSWLVRVLPYSNGPEQGEPYNNLSLASQRFKLPINSPKLKKDGEWIHNRKMPSLLCPSTPPDRQTVRGKHLGLKDGQVSNYMALVAGCVDGSRHVYGDVNPTTGGIMVTQQASPKGLKIGDCKDGTSKTILVGESKAENFAYWASGVSTSTIGMPPDLVQCSRITRNKPDGFPAPKENIPSAVNYGDDARKEKSDHWFWEPNWGVHDWGISSNHDGGFVVHAFVDGSVRLATKEIDAAVYFRAITRGGGEPYEDWKAEPVTRLGGDPPEREPSATELSRRVERLERQVDVLKKAMTLLSQELEEAQ